MELVVMPLDAATEMQCESVRFLGIEAGKLEQIARKAGASSVESFGSYNKQPYDRDESVDLIVIAEK